MGDNSILNKAKEAKFKTRWSAYQEQTDAYTTWKIASTMDTNIDDIHAGNTLKDLIEMQADVDIKEEDIHYSISEILNNLEKQDEKYAVVYHGRLHYVKSDTNRYAEKEARLV